MFDIGWSEMAVIALVALIVIGPKELPQALRAAAKWVRKARSLAREFQSGVDDIIRESELDDARKAIQSTRNLDLDTMLEDTVDPTGTVRDEAQSIEHAARDAGEPDTGSSPAAPQAQDGPARATVVKHPVNVAPPHSVTPPREPQAEATPDAAGAAAGDDGSQKRA